ncbi:MAG: nucleotide exchange factor GrpE [Halobacteriota archaeon]
MTAEQTSLLKELDHVKQQNEEYFSRLQRLQADFENFKRRTKTQSEHRSKYACVELIKELLVISDNLERAVEAPQSESNQGIAEGIGLIRKQLCDILGRSGVRRIKSVGELFDPHLHEAIMTEGDINLPDNVITKEIQKGYTLHEKVIRHSKVKVNKSTNEVDR